MIITIDPTDSRPIYLQIMDEVRRSVVVGTAQADDPLPSVRHLAGELRLNPNTVQQAYRELEREGVVYVRRGRGTFIAEVETTDRERGRLAQTVAQRAWRDAYRNGLTLNELTTAVRRAAEEMDVEENS